jgi:uncharacterized RDD family membrane protein YckC
VAQQPVAVAPAPSVAIYAGLWRRFAAQLIDSVVLYLIGALIGGLVGFFMALGGATSTQAALIGAMLGLLASAIYEIAFHASSFQATVGKAALRIKVTDEEGARISVARSTGRYAGKFLSSCTLGVGFVMAGFTRRRQALHDRIARTLVVRAQAPATLVATAAPAPPAGPVRIALLLLLGLLPYVALWLAIVPLAWQAMQQSAATSPATLGPQVTPEEIEAGQRLVRAALFALQSDRAQLSQRLASGESFEAINGTLEIDARNVESVDVLKGAILVVFGDDALPGLAREQLALVPARRADGSVTWLCGYAERPPGVTMPIDDYYEYTSVDEAFLPEMCRQMPWGR